MGNNDDPPSALPMGRPTVTGVDGKIRVDAQRPQALGLRHRDDCAGGAFLREGEGLTTP